MHLGTVGRNASQRVHACVPPAATATAASVKRAIAEGKRATQNGLSRLVDDCGRRLPQLVSAPLQHHLLEAVCCLDWPPDRHCRHEGEVFHQTDLVALWRLRRADDAPLRVVQLPRLGVLSLAARRAIDTAQVAERGRKGEPVQRLQTYEAQVMTYKAAVCRLRALT
jgi:hypothetical protein